MREGRRLGLIVLVDALLHVRGGNEGVVRHEKKFFGYVDGELPHALRPALEFVQIDAQYAVDHILGGYGNVRPFVGHDGLLEAEKGRARQSVTALRRPDDVTTRTVRKMPTNSD